MSRRKSVLPTSHTVDAPAPSRPSKYFTRLVPVPGKLLTFTSVPARAVDCDHCGEELRPAEFAGIRYRTCPNACMSDYAAAVNAYYGHLEDDPGYSEA